jgi:hypothetical protein
LGYEAFGIITGPVFRMGESKVLRVWVRDLNGLFHEYLERLRERRPGIISEKGDVREVYSFQRSIRRGFASHARNEVISSDVIDGRSMWRSHEAAKGGRTTTFGGNMMERDTDVKEAITSLLRYSESIVDAGAAISTAAQVSRDQQCGRMKETGGG